MSTTQVDAFWMKRCKELAQKALDAGDAAVGAILVRQSDNQEIAHAQETVLSAGDPTGHAEINVLRHAVVLLGVSDLSGCTLYTNMEPCWMCSYLLRELR
jgi:tRNA(adenine34) deaminase